MVLWRLISDWRLTWTGLYSALMSCFDFTHHYRVLSQQQLLLLPDSVGFFFNKFFLLLFVRTLIQCIDSLKSDTIRFKRDSSSSSHLLSKSICKVQPVIEMKVHFSHSGLLEVVSWETAHSSLCLSLVLTDERYSRLTYKTQWVRITNNTAFFLEISCLVIKEGVCSVNDD